MAGNDKALKALEEKGNVITIPAEEINVEGISADKVFEVDITQYLPDGLKLSSSMTETVIVYVSVLPVNSREIAVDVDQIDVKGLASGLTVSYDNPEITVIVSAIDTKLAALTQEDLKLSVDVDGKDEGDYTDLPVEVELPSGVALVTKPTITIHIKEKPETTTEPTASPTPETVNTGKAAAVQAEGT